MSGTHGDLFSEIGKLVLAAHAGQCIDLQTKSEELARRYGNLGVPAETMAKAIARSLGAVGISMALVAQRSAPATRAEDAIDPAVPRELDGQSDGLARPVAGLFPSGVRLALLS